MSDRKLWVRGGIAGMLGIASYIIAITVPWPETQLGASTALVVASAWPILSIVYIYSLYSFVAAEHESTANRLALLFATAGFTTVLAMLVVQLAIAAGLGEITRGLDEPSAAALRRGLRLIDHGLDVAWDLLIGTALFFSGISMRPRRGLGLAWAVPSAALGVALVVLNVATFPWPPAASGLFDIGPLIGVFVFALGARLVLLGWGTNGSPAPGGLGSTSR
jgi:hypothetical protein